MSDWQPIPNSTKHGERRRRGGGWEYRYPARGGGHVTATVEEGSFRLHHPEGGERGEWHPAMAPPEVGATLRFPASHGGTHDRTYTVSEIRGDSVIVSESGRHGDVQRRLGMREWHRLAVDHGEVQHRYRYEVAKSVGEWADGILLKGGEGSRGGKVIAYTRTGKPVYASHDHPAHSGFSREDHAHAARTHLALADRMASKERKLKDPGKRKAALADVARHQENAKGHMMSAALVKGGDGEGSRGGHIIGHTKSGKPIYASRWSTSYSAQDHSDAALAHAAKASAGGNTPHASLTQRHRRAAAQRISKVNNGGEIVGKTESGLLVFGPSPETGLPHPQSSMDMLQNMSATEHREIASAHRDAKRRLNVELRNSHERRYDGGAEEKQDHQDDLQHRIYVHGLLESRHNRAALDVESGRMDDMAATGHIEKGGKGEGARGGKIIGHTRSGKPIYAPNGASGAIHAQSVRGVDKHSSDDHADFISAHMKASAEHHAAQRDRSMSSKDVEMHRTLRDAHYMAASNHHIALHGSRRLGEKPSAVRAKNVDEREDAKDRKVQRRRGLGIRKGGKGEGSRGGKIIGHTRSGKPIYEGTSANYSLSQRGHMLSQTSTGKDIYATPEAPAHSSFTATEHTEAAEAHDLAARHYDREYGDPDLGHDQRMSAAYQRDRARERAASHRTLASKAP